MIHVGDNVGDVGVSVSVEVKTSQTTQKKQKKHQ
jgi:hypothetical protein